VRKNYIAIVHGTPKINKGRIETCIARDPKDRKRFMVADNGKSALTFYKVIKNWQTHSLLLLRPRTGRTHQLRVHLRHIGCPILGDPVYGSKDRIFPEATLMLHSKSLTITLPDEKKERIFTSPVPERFLAVIDKLNRMNSNE
jgi:23S rRNA pseudouridine1911/1915/1917 synthase